MIRVPVPPEPPTVAHAAPVKRQREYAVPEPETQLPAVAASVTIARVPVAAVTGRVATV